MAGEWREYRIGDIAEVIGGSTPSTSDPSNFDGDVPWLTPKDLSSPHDRFVLRGQRNLSRKGLQSCSAQLLPPKAVLLSSRAPIGYVAIAKGPIATNQGFRNLVLRPGFEPEFVYYWLTANCDELERHASGSTFKELSGSALKQIRIRVPPLPEQRAIAHILGTLDDKIELNRQQNETLEAMARALFKAWFVDFEPVRAKMEGRWQRGQSLPGLPAHLYDLFPDRLVESELGEIPEGWGVQPLSELLVIIGGGTPKTSIAEYWDGDIPWFSVVDTPAAGDVFVVSTEKTITSQGVANSSARLIPKGTAIISARGTVGNLAIAGREMAFNQSCYGLRGTGGAGDYFVYLTTQQMVDQLKSMAHGSVFSTITRQTFEAIKRPVPRLPVLAAFEGLVTAWFEDILSNVEASHTLAQLRDTLLPKLISGELRVSEVEETMAEAMTQ
jgi:type I restriction enzyme S subunit